MNILMVLTSHDALGNTGKKTGLWLEEFAAPYYTFLDAGAEITVASPAAGQPPIDPSSDAPDAQTAFTDRLKADPAALAVLATTVALGTVRQADFDGVFYPGGHGPLWDLAESPVSIKLIESFDRAGKPIAFVCHAPGVLRHVTTASGDPIVKGRTVTGFTNSEETAVGLIDVVPFKIQDEFTALGADYRTGPDWAPFVLQDGMLITGQNPASSEDVAKALLAQIAAVAAA